MFDRLRQILEKRGKARQTSFCLELACVSNTGHHRLHNEDNLLFMGEILPQEHQSLETPKVATVGMDAPVALAVFDGMGGELAGDAASFVAAASLQDKDPGQLLTQDGMLDAFRDMQAAVTKMRASRRLSSSGSTAVVLACGGRSALVANLGDSSAFLLRFGDLLDLHVPHTDERLVRMLGLDRKPALTQYLGMDETDAPMEPHIMELPLQVGDRIVLASDGLADMVERDQIAHTMARATNMPGLAAALCEQALANGGKDNVTVLACGVTGDSASRTTGTTR